jgi:GDP-4-dehydro-6-deoxy-D-mannose reductase
MRTLITGGSGFVARNVFTQLQLMGQDLVRADVLAVPESGVVRCDLCVYSEVRNLLEKNAPERIYNLAGTFTNDYGVDWPANYQATKNVLDAVHELGLPSRVLLIGSAAEYGRIQEEDNPVLEAHPLRPVSVYGLTKAMQTMLMQFYSSSLGMDIVLARPFNLLGRGISKRLFVGRVYAELDRVIAGDAQTINVGNLDSRRDYLKIEDAARCFRLVMENGKTGEVYNVASGSSISMRELLESILHEHGLSMDIVRSGSGNRSGEYDPETICADISKLKSLQVSI